MTWDATVERCHTGMLRKANVGGRKPTSQHTCVCRDVLLQQGDVVFMLRSASFNLVSGSSAPG